MPTTKSAKKRLRQSEQKRLRNRSVKSELKTKIRKVREAIEAKSIEQANTEFRGMTKQLDQAAARNVIHRNKAARTKSRLQKQIKALKASAPAS